MDRRHAYGSLVGAVGVLLALIQFIQGLQQISDFEGQTRIVVFAFETVPFILIGLTLVAVGYWVAGQKPYEPDLPRIAAWGVGSVVLFASVGSLMLFSLVVTFGIDPVGTDPLDQAPFLAMNMITVGAVVGVLVGLYDAQSRQRARELEAERDRVEQFAAKAADVNNYGRELNRSATIDEVSSLCIQAMQAFLGITDMAFVVVEDGESQLVDNTIISIDDEAIGERARDALDQEQATVATTPAPADAPDSTAELLTILISGAGETSFVLLALRRETTSINEEDIQLLEMLVAHAATSLDRITRVDSTGKDGAVSTP